MHRLTSLLSWRRTLQPLVFARGIFYEPNPIRPKRKEPLVPHLRKGLKLIVPELSKFKDEWVKKIRCDEVRWEEHGDYEVVWKFDTQESVDKWVVSTDHDDKIRGRSRAEFIFGHNQTAIFRGCVDTSVPKDGATKYSGYCNINSGKNMKSFMRETPFDWDRYTHLLLRLRGDGRPYQLTLGMDRYFDVQWNDIYTYPLYTRGGPYWQLTAIPFSKFFLAGKGRIQDKQAPIDLLKVISLGITLSDGYSGPFSLELDFIGLYFDSTHRDIFDYELYQIEPHLFY